MCIAAGRPGRRDRQHLPRRRRVRPRGRPPPGADRPSALPDDVRLVDYGIRGMHLLYDLLDGYEALVLVDALPGRGRPGEIGRAGGRARRTWERSAETSTRTG